MQENGVQLFKKLLTNVAEQIMADDPDAIIDSVAPPTSEHDRAAVRDVIMKTRDRMQRSYARTVEEHIDDVFQRLDIPERHLVIRKLEGTRGNATAWRPSTGELPICPVVVMCYENHKKQLQQRLTDLKSAGDFLEKEVEKAKLRVLETQRAGQVLTDAVCSSSSGGEVLEREEPQN